jgi:hypothetical protein
MANPVNSVNIARQLGFESSLGGGGAANYLLQSLTIEPGDELTVQEIIAQGNRFPSAEAVEEAWTSLAVSGDALYTETLLCLENFFGTVSPTTVGTSTKKRIYDLVRTGAITPRGWSGQFGDAADNVNTFNYGLLTDFGMKFDREQGVSIDGAAGIARVIATGGTFTSTPTALASVPILGTHINYYLDTTGSGIGTTQIMDEVLGCSWNVKGLKGPRWVSDRAQTSYKGHVDLVPSSEVKLDLAESSVTRAIVAALKAGGTYFLQVNCQGPLTESGQNYMLNTDLAFQVTGIDKYADSKGVYMRTISGKIVYDATWTHALRMTSQTLLATV